jgi:hypothetical protein
MRRTITFWLILFSLSVAGQNRWKTDSDGSIKWEISNNLPHYDHIEMSGEQVSTVLRYGVNADSSFSMERSIIWPMLRTIPNNTHASLNIRSAIDFTSLLIVNGKVLKKEKVQSLSLNGLLTVVSAFSSPEPLMITRIIFPSTTLSMICEKYIIRNKSSKPVSILIPEQKTLYHTDPLKGVDGSYTVETKIQNSGVFTVLPGDEISFSAYIQAYSQSKSEIFPDTDNELAARKAFVGKMWDNLVLETPDSTLNKMFAFAKIRGAESIYRTSGGLMHGPGGEAYYAAIWANDQAEYIGPFFPFLGYLTGNEATFNAYMHFARFMTNDFKPVPSSIIAEGKDIWNGAGDRGDAAMIAYGAARFALALGNRDEAEKLWPLIEWCLEYCRRKLNNEGVVTSDSDELEGRFPSGNANLCTSSLYYDALLSAAYLGRDLNKSASVTAKYRKEAFDLKNAINRYFGAEVKGYKTYQYYKGCTLLRSWICMPLVVGIHDRSAGTIDALFSPKLWTKNGLLTQEGSETYWDRSTLYALRGVFAAGETEKAASYLSYYSNLRLLGEHVPYAIEAWPEGNQRHLSAESGLFCRIITEGIFGIRPAGIRSCSITPHLPQAWNIASLKRIHAFGSDFDIILSREQGKVRVTVNDQAHKVLCNRVIRDGESVNVSF